MAAGASATARWQRRPPGWPHALKASGVEPGDRVAYLCPNIPELLVAHFGVPLAGAVLVAINTRLSSEEIRYILEHSGARLLVVDTELTPLLEPILEDLGGVEEIVAVDDTGRGSSVPATGSRRPHGPRRRPAHRLGGRRRGPDHLDQLHERNHWKTQGCHVHPPGGASQRLGEVIHSRHSVRLGVPMDPPHVPLQRLVHHVGGDRHRWDACLSARGRSRLRCGGCSGTRASPISTPPRRS